MDGLDTYIDDYSISDPIPEAMLKTMKQAQDIIVAGQERREQAAKQEAAERQRLAAAGGEGGGAEAALPAAAPESVVPAADVAVQPENNDKGTQRG
jgi:hypothetical protein